MEVIAKRTHVKTVCDVYEAFTSLTNFVPTKVIVKTECPTCAQAHIPNTLCVFCVYMIYIT